MTDFDGNGLGETPSPERVAELVRSLATVMHQTAVTELDLELGQMSVRLRRPEWSETGRAVPPIEDEPDTSDRPLDVGHVITAPMVGTFYAAPTPSASPFIAEGDDVLAGQTIGIIEAMKIMNEISADRSGVVQEILARNGQPVEYGSPLVRLGSRREMP